MTEDNRARNPEQRVIDEIDALVEWQFEEGRRRGDGPRPSETALTNDNVAETIIALRNAISRVCTLVNGVQRLARTIPLIDQSEVVGARIRGADLRTRSLGGYGSLAKRIPKRVADNLVKPEMVAGLEADAKGEDFAIEVKESALLQAWESWPTKVSTPSS